MTLDKNNEFLLFYENGQGKIVDEKGNDAMDWEEEADPFHLETLTTMRKYIYAQEQISTLNEDLDAKMEEIAVIEEIKGKNKTHSYNEYSNEQKLLFAYYNHVKFYNATKSAKMTGVATRTAQTWAKKLNEK